ncbi:cyclohexanone monooxygenase [Venturia nashicola]|uniref:Cyclohexanone monooxygenase n=1 Tax=Venturia nashicola TaxID=86259 RepID=A0A4Z1P474_9PEZI|nr:cyclohexanone monooxygenase [Venturia nashicola]TLD22491.1 cyclohexanone monooxygenase [Venturia nashicola]
MGKPISKRDSHQSFDSASDKKIDRSTLKEKYAQEREKRMNKEGVHQYHKVPQEVLAEFQKDPWSDPNFKRDAIHKNIDVLVLGAGFGGQLTAARLIQAGVEDFLMVDKAADFGGAWYYNRYPGVSCDTESYIYMPLLEELGYVPSEKYCKGGEVREHAQNIGRHFGLYEKCLFQTEVKKLDWEEGRARWKISTSLGDVISARFVVSAGGSLHVPKLPGLEGIEKFGGRSFHTSRWDFGFTGGDTHGRLDKLKGKKVAIVGTGASSVQVTSYVAESAEHLYVFSRTPSSVDKRYDQPTDQKWAKQTKAQKGWQRERINNFNIIVTGGKAEKDMVKDSWTKTMQKVPHWGGKSSEASIEDDMDRQTEADYQKMEEIRERIDEIVMDKEKAEKLKPWYNLFCKRPCFNNEYLPAFNRENVTLIDLTEEGKGEQYIDEKGIQIGSTHYDVDCIVYASGFEFGSDYSSRLGIEMTGQNNVTLKKKWEDGISTLHGLTSRGFPNAFFLTINQSGYTQNNTHALDEQATHSAYIISQIRERGINYVQPKQAAEDEWVDTIISMAKEQYKFVEDCTPGYYNDEGQEGEKWLKGASYGKGSPAFFKLLEEWREEGALEGLEVVYDERGEGRDTEMDEKKSALIEVVEREIVEREVVVHPSMEPKEMTWLGLVVYGFRGLGLIR